MTNILEYRDDAAPRNEYPRRIVSPTRPSTCCLTHMERVGRGAIDSRWRFYYKWCAICGYTVRCFYAPSLLSAVEETRKIRLAMAAVNLGTQRRKRRSAAEVAAELAAARSWPLPANPIRGSLSPLRRRRCAPAPGVAM